MANKLGSLPAANTEVYSAGEVDTLLDGKIPYFEGTRGDGETDTQVLERITNGKTVKVGGIAVIKTVAGGSTTYTAYRYTSDDGSAPAWKAMDGNYSADNVVFDSDLIFTADIGVKKIDASGSGVISAQGKTVAQVLKAILAQEKYPATPTVPSATITLTNAGGYECGTKITPAWKTTFNKGKYEYGPDTGITPNAAIAYHGTTADADKVDIAEGELDGATGSFSEITLTAGQTFKAKVNWSTPASDATPVTNMGNDATVADIEGAEGSAVSKIAAQTNKTATSSNAITGYRMGRFNGSTTTVVTEADVTSAVIRALQHKSLTANATGSFTMLVPVGARSLIIAAAGNRTLTKVLNTTVNADMTTSFVKCSKLISVCGADAPSTDNAGDYSVWIYTPAEAYASEASLSITIA